MPDTLKVLSYNAKSRNTEALEDMRTMIERVRPDIVGIQEASVRFLDKGTGYSLEVVPVLRTRRYQLPPLFTESQRTINQPIFTSGGAKWLTERTLPLTEWREGGDVAKAQFRWEGQDIVVYNVHLRSYLGEGVPWNERDGWFRRVVKLYRTLRRDVHIRAEEGRVLKQMLEAESAPYIVLIDMNATRHSWLYRHLTPGLQDVTRSFSGVFQPTYPARFPLFSIDYIFASREWSVLDATIGPRLISDHRPVLTMLQLRDSP